MLGDMGHKRAVCILLECILVTTRKRSLGQGNIFTPVCHSVHRGGLPQCMLGYHHPQDHAPSPAGGYGQQVGGMHPTGMHTCCLLSAGR